MHVLSAFMIRAIVFEASAQKENIKGKKHGLVSRVLDFDSENLGSIPNLTKSSYVALGKSLNLQCASVLHQGG